MGLSHVSKELADDLRVVTLGRHPEEVVTRVSTRTSRLFPDPVPGALWIPLRNRGEIVAYTLIDEQDAQLARLTWRLAVSGYAARREKWQNHPDGRGRARIVLLHRVILGAPPGVEVDHINRHRLDNRRSNLRFATDGEQARNCSRNKRNTSGYKGVCFESATRRWKAAVAFEGRSHHVGLFHTPQAAAFAYDFAATALHGEFAATNFQLSEASKEAALEFRAFLLGERAGQSVGAAG